MVTFFKFRMPAPLGLRPTNVAGYRFATFEADLRAWELRRDGQRVSLQDLPLQILVTLLHSSGELVSREELRKQLWPGDIFVDFEDGLNTAMRKLRIALDDSADQPRFIETVPRRGYRFIAPVTAVNPAQPATQSWRRHQFLAVAVSVSVLAVLAIGGLLLRHRMRTTVPRKVMLVVLPFENLTGEPDDEYVSDGLTDELIARLGVWNPQRLGVIARTSAMRYKKTRKAVDEIAREMKVDFLLESSVWRSSAHRRVVVQLVQARDQTHLWAGTYDYDASAEPLRMQEDLANRVAPAVAETLLLGRAQTPQTSSANPAAREAYLRGRYYLAKRRPKDLLLAAAHFGEAVKHDPQFALAWTELANAKNLIAFDGMSATPATELRLDVATAAMRALELAPDLGEAHSAVALYRVRFEYDWPAAEREFQRAIALNPNDANAHYQYANLLTTLSRFEEARTEVLRARMLDPVSPGSYTLIALLALFARHPDECIRLNQQLLELDPNYEIAYVTRARALEQKGLFREAIANSERALALAGRVPLYLGSLGYEYAASGDTDRAAAVVRELEEFLPRGFGAESMAKTYVGLKQYERAIDYLEKAYELRSTDMVYVAVDPKFDPLRSHPRFQVLLQRMRLWPQTTRAKG